MRDVATLVDRSEWHRQLFWWCSTWPGLQSRPPLPWIRCLGFSTELHTVWACGFGIRHTSWSHCASLSVLFSLCASVPVWRITSFFKSSASLTRCAGTVASQRLLCLLASTPSEYGISRPLHYWVIAELLAGFRREPGPSHHEVCNRRWSLGDRGEMAMSPLACCSCPPYVQMLSLSFVRVQ